MYQLKHVIHKSVAKSITQSVCTTAITQRHQKDKSKCKRRKQTSGCCPDFEEPTSTKTNTSTTMCEQQRKDPCEQQRKGPCEHQRKDPCEQRRKDPCEQQRKDPWDQQRKDPCEQRRKDPCEQQRKDPLYQQRKDPCEQQRNDPYECSSVSEDTRKTSKCEQQRKDPCEQQRKDLCEQQRKDPCVQQSIDPCPKQDCPEIPSACNQDAGPEHVQQLKEMEKAWGEVVHESQKTWKLIESQTKNCPEKCKKDMSAHPLPPPPSTSPPPPPPPPPPPRPPPSEKSCPGKFPTLCYLIGAAFLANLAYCVYKHGEESKEIENENEEK